MLLWPSYVWTFLSISHQTLLPPCTFLPPPVPANYIYKTLISALQFKWIHLCVQQKVASGFAPLEARWPVVHMAELHIQPGWFIYDNHVCPMPSSSRLRLYSCLGLGWPIYYHIPFQLLYFYAGKRDGGIAGWRGLHVQMPLTLVAT